MYLAKAIKNSDDLVIGYDIKYQIDKPMKPRGEDYEILYGVNTNNPKAEKTGDTWQVVEDEDKKLNKEKKNQDKLKIKRELAEFVDNDSGAPSLNQLKSIIKKIAVLLGD